MLDELEPDVISAAGPYHLHGIECLEAAKRGIHVFSEKPLALKLDELAAIEKNCAETRTKIVSMVGIRYNAHLGLFTNWSKRASSVRSK